MERRQEWAAKAEQRAEARFSSAHRLVEGIPFGQPILVGHHSEGRHRRTIDRMASHMTKGCEETSLAERHVSKAGGLADQLDRSIFSDDADAISAIEARIAAHEADRATMRQANAYYRKSVQLGTTALRQVSIGQSRRAHSGR
jgi:hypothetical protein